MRQEIPGKQVNDIKVEEEKRHVICQFGRGLSEISFLELLRATLGERFRFSPLRDVVGIELFIETFGKHLAKSIGMKELGGAANSDIIWTPDLDEDDWFLALAVNGYSAPPLGRRVLLATTDEVERTFNLGATDVIRMPTAEIAAKIAAVLDQEIKPFDWQAIRERLNDRP